MKKERSMDANQKLMPEITKSMGGAIGGYLPTECWAKIKK